MTYRLSRRAEQDLIDIYVASVEAFGPAQAERYQDVLEQAFDLIAEYPLIARERPELIPPARIHPCKSHIIVYLIDAAGPLILRVRHGAEDWRNSNEP
jgi:toxin ParE1/3/4